MNSDPLQSLETRLFDAARSEVLPQGVEERVVLAARKRRETARTPLWTERAAVWLLLAAAVLSAAAFVLRRKDPNVAITAEPSHRGQVEAPPPSPPAEPASAAVHSEPPREAAPVAPSRPSVSQLPHPTPSAQPATLADELAALKRAESALSSGDATSALAELDHYDRVLRGKQMRAEATLLRMEALSQAGRAAAAEALAERFVRDNPESPLVDRARTFLSKKSIEPTERSP
jgi:hypothetical protein